ncbi:MAG: glycosyltransferase family 39 protein [Verrucomicrobia bacterium]|nr:glycosyltransferase family 39 protein [Verrucomicrobiota bacterium]
MFPSHQDDGLEQAPPLRLGWALVLSVLLLQFVSRYLPSPWAVFVADDWPNYARSTFYASHAEAALTGLQDPNRPLSMAAVEVVYRLFGTHRSYWTALSLLSNSLMLWFIMRMGLELTGSRRVAVLQGVLFALWPNLTETWHWSTQILNEVTCALLFYALSGWLFMAHVRRGGAWRLTVSALAYGIGLFSYEQGILLPAAFLAILPWRRERWRAVWRMIPFGLLFLLYGAWRTTGAFGLSDASHYPPHMQVGGFSWWFLGWNARQVAHWWIGDRFFGAILAGLDSFATLSLWTRRALMLGNVAAVTVGVWLLRRLFQKDEEAPSTPGIATGQAVAFGVVWSGAAVATSLTSYTAGRLNILPAMGLALLGGLLLARLPWRIWLAALFVPAVICLAANQGSAENFRQAGEFNRRLFVHLQDTRSKWENKEVLLFETASLRHRRTPGLLGPVSSAEATWAEYGNALLFRGFVPLGMVQLIARGGAAPAHVLHDVECGARIEGDELFWHTRYQPEETHRTPMTRVFVVDVWAATQPSK